MKEYLIHSSRKGFPVAVLTNNGKVLFHGWTRQHNLANGENVEFIADSLGVLARDMIFFNTNTGIVYSYGADISFLTMSDAELCPHMS